MRVNRRRIAHVIPGYGYFHHDPERGGLIGTDEDYPKRKRCPICPKLGPRGE